VKYLWCIVRKYFLVLFDLIGHKLPTEIEMTIVIFYTNKAKLQHLQSFRYMYDKSFCYIPNAFTQYFIILKIIKS